VKKEFSLSTPEKLKLKTMMPLMQIKLKHKHRSFSRRDKKSFQIQVVENKKLIFKFRFPQLFEFNFWRIMFKTWKFNHSTTKLITSFQKLFLILFNTLFTSFVSLFFCSFILCLRSSDSQTWTFDIVQFPESFLF
jgi:UDP-galactopyranose mutase